MLVYREKLTHSDIIYIKVNTKHVPSEPNELSIMYIKISDMLKN